MQARRYNPLSQRRRGSSLVVVMVLTSSMALLSLAMITLISSSQRAELAEQEELSALYVCEAGLSAAVFDLAQDGSGALGSSNVPVEWAGAEYWVESNDLGGGITSLVATGVDDGSRARVQLVLREVESGFFEWAAFGDEWMTMDSNARVDSYDSTAGTYASQAVNGSGSDQHANSDGNIGSNANITVAGNTSVWGSASPGPSGTITVVGTATVTGSTTPLAGTVDLPPLEVPALASSGNTVPASIPAGEVMYGDVVLRDNVTITGPATVVFNSLELKSSKSIIVDGSAGPVEIYVLHDFIMNSNTTIRSTTYDPRQVTINLLSDNILDPDERIDLDAVEFESNAQLFGTIYAPNASIEIESNFELFGALMARRVHLDSNARVHFDESLRSVSYEQRRTFATVCWRILPRS